MITPKFDLGLLLYTPSALETFSSQEQQQAIDRHAMGDWGDLEDEDKRANDGSVLDGSQISSSYVFPGGRKLWVITAAIGENNRREYTTLLLPGDY